MHDLALQKLIPCFDLKDSCLDKAAEMALLPSFEGCIGEITIPGMKGTSIFPYNLSYILLF